MSNSGEYEVGYGKPPQATRWLKGGHSPSLRGRPKKKLELERARSTRQLHDDMSPLWTLSLLAPRCPLLTLR